MKTDRAATALRAIGRVLSVLALLAACMVSSEAVAFADCTGPTPTATATPTATPTATATPSPTSTAYVPDGSADCPYYVAALPSQYVGVGVFGAAILLVLTAGFFLKFGSSSYLDVRRAETRGEGV